MKLFLYSIFISLQCLAQLPNTDIWLFQLKKKDNQVICTAPINITNRVGYDNQPTFTADGKSIMYVSIGDDKQADIYKYDIVKKTHTNFTKSEVSEYSPTLLPDGSGFSAVVVEKDSAQRIWAFNNDGSFNRIIDVNIDSVGYHTWLNTDTLLYYKLTQPHSLHALNLTSHKDVWICNDPTRAFKQINGSPNFIFGIKDSTSITYYIYNSALKESNVFTKGSLSNEDFIYHPQWGLIKSEGSDLLKYNEQSKTWEKLFSFSDFGIKKITRFAFDTNNKQLVIVSNL